MTAETANVTTSSYRVDGEVGRFMFETHQVTLANGAQRDTRAYFPHLTGQEWYRTVGFKELGLVHGTVSGSYRQSATWLNRVRHQPHGTPWRTLSHNSEQEGQRVLTYLEQKTAEILAHHEFSAGHPPTPQQVHYAQQTFAAQSPAQVQASIAQCAPDARAQAAMTANPVPYEVAAQSVHISIDPVGVKHQKESHDKVPKEKQRDMVYQTVAHLQQGAQTYLFNGAEIATVLRYL